MGPLSSFLNDQTDSSTRSKSMAVSSYSAAARSFDGHLSMVRTLGQLGHCCDSQNVRCWTLPWFRFAEVWGQTRTNVVGNRSITLGTLLAKETNPCKKIQSWGHRSLCKIAIHQYSSCHFYTRETSFKIATAYWRTCGKVWYVRSQGHIMANGNPTSSVEKVTGRNHFWPGIQLWNPRQRAFVQGQNAQKKHSSCHSSHLPFKDFWNFFACSSVMTAAWLGAMAEAMRVRFCWRAVACLSASSLFFERNFLSSSFLTTDRACGSFRELNTTEKLTSSPTSQRWACLACK